ncbi:uncharacterized protein METZ01_LOCUS475862, partial [marine metagenome]
NHHIQDTSEHPGQRQNLAVSEFVYL